MLVVSVTPDGTDSVLPRAIARAAVVPESCRKGIELDPMRLDRPLQNVDMVRLATFLCCEHMHVWRT